MPSRKQMKKMMKRMKRETKKLSSKVSAHARSKGFKVWGAGIPTEFKSLGEHLRGAGALPVLRQVRMPLGHSDLVKDVLNANRK